MSSVVLYRIITLENPVDIGRCKCLNLLVGYHGEPTVNLFS